MEAEVVFDKLDLALYRIELLEAEIAYNDTLHQIEMGWQQDKCSTKKTAITWSVVGAVVGALFIWLGASL